MHRFSPILFVVLLAVGCGDDAECHERDTVRCSEDGHGLQRCEQTEAGLRWTPSACPEATPSCVESGVRDAVCVAERVGDCDVTTFHDRCVDEHTLEDCAAFRGGRPEGALHRLSCAEGERCGEVPAHAIAEGRAPGASHACYAGRARVTPRALVTFVHGDVRLGDRPAPPVPFQVPLQTRLRLGEGARAVVLVKEQPSRLEGPIELDVYDRQPEDVVPSPEAARIVEILAAPPPPDVPPAEPLMWPAPSETGVVRLLVGEGVPGASAVLPTVRWQCEEDCGRTVQLRTSDHTARVVWRGMGEGTAPYEGPELEAGRTYELRIGERAYRVETVAAAGYSELMARMRDWPLAESMSVLAALHRWGGSRAAAVALLTRSHIENHRADPDMVALLEAYGAPTR